MSHDADSLLVAVAQLTSIDETQRNLTSMFQLLDRVAAHGKVDLVSFPENALYMRIESQKPIDYLQLGDEPFQKLSAWAKKHACAIHLGAVPLKIDGRHFNATVLVLPDGHVESPYQKIHLFDVDLDQQRSIRESDAFEPGVKPFVWDFRGWKFGLTICYDLRFSELYRAYSQAEVDCILIPSAFTVPTGQAHWEILLRARAIESQCYVVAAAQGGTHRNHSSETRATYGHSMAIDPWGTILAEAKGEENLLIVTLDKSRLKHVRRQIPMSRHRRL